MPQRNSRKGVEQSKAEQSKNEAAGTAQGSSESETMIGMPTSKETRQRYRILAAKKDVTLAKVARHGFSIWESLDGELPPERMLKVLGKITSSMDEVVPLTGVFVEPPEDIDCQPGDYGLLITDYDGLEDEAVLCGVDAGRPGDLIGVFRPNGVFEDRVVHLERTEENKVQLRKVSTLKDKRDRVRLDPGGEIRLREEIVVEVRGVMVDCWAVS